MFFFSGGSEFEFYQEFPVNIVHDFEMHTGHKTGPAIILVFQYGINFSGPNKDVFRVDRATGEPSDGHNSNFLHPVLYYYKTLPTGKYLGLFRLMVI